MVLGSAVTRKFANRKVIFISKKKVIYMYVQCKRNIERKRTSTIKQVNSERSTNNLDKKKTQLNKRKRRRMYNAQLYTTYSIMLLDTFFLFYCNVHSTRIDKNEALMLFAHKTKKKMITAINLFIYFLDNSFFPFFSIPFFLFCYNTNTSLSWSKKSGKRTTPPHNTNV